VERRRTGDRNPTSKPTRRRYGTPQENGTPFVGQVFSSGDEKACIESHTACGYRPVNVFNRNSFRLKKRTTFQTNDTWKMTVGSQSVVFLVMMMLQQSVSSSYNASLDLGPAATFALLSGAALTNTVSIVPLRCLDENCDQVLVCNS